MSDREPFWPSTSTGFNEQLRHQCALDYDAALETKTDAAIVA